MTPEGRVKALVKRRLQGLQHCYSFWPVQTGMGAATLDNLLSVGGRSVYIETKAPGAKLTPRQETTRENMLRSGALVYVIDSEASMDACMMTLTSLDNFYHQRHEARATPVGILPL